MVFYFTSFFQEMNEQKLPKLRSTKVLIKLGKLKMGKSSVAIDNMSIFILSIFILKWLLGLRGILAEPIYLFIYLLHFYCAVSNMYKISFDGAHT